MDGVEFNCKQCGHCCRREGLVFLTTEDLHQLQDYFKLDHAQLKEKYLSTYNRQLILKEHPSGGCVFAREPDGRCPIYEVRPHQCRTYPYWPEAIIDKNWFIDESRLCPGIKPLP